MTGYMGRTSIHEMLVMSPALRRMVQPGMDLAPFREQAVREGMQPLRLAGARHVAAGNTTADEIARCTPPANEG